MNSLALLHKLVGFDTTSRLSNLALIGFVQDYLAGFGITSQLVEDATGTKANLYATIGPTDRGGIMLAGHTDVVPVDGQHWQSEPFTLDIRDGRAYGRGSADMKGFIAAVLAAVPALAGANLSMPVHIALTYDEEIGCIGVRRLLDVLGGLPVLPVMGIVGEPTTLRVIAAHKGKTAFRVSVRGHEGHSSNPLAGVNAVEYAAELITFIRKLARERQQNGPFDPLYEVPYTTLHVGTVRGGTALNIIPAECVFDFEIRHLPEDPPDALIAAIRQFAAQTLEPAMQAVAADTGISFTERSTYPGLCTPPDAAVVRFVQGLLGDDTAPGKIAFGTEGGLFAERCGIPTVVCGPGDIAQAHQPDEWLALDQLAACDAMLANLVQQLTQ
ncbi:acetylornithine deacetylase [Silvimonas iriomotensis]|uniref:Acetylornithine deacetylase n=1 Tax=Silvimonas iriomotensis TaxID=449662 RepID=A0ABQ2P9D5_9NEIS|nr:acetylornithine deacetylase [Silvimonas iriomotensis]GGP21601.1 acetylornithine deacetylase [Silvimonas iriomotensis]